MHHCSYQGDVLAVGVVSVSLKAFGEYFGFVGFVIPLVPTSLAITVLFPIELSSFRYFVLVLYVPSPLPRSLPFFVFLTVICVIVRHFVLVIRGPLPGSGSLSIALLIRHAAELLGVVFGGAGGTIRGREITLGNVPSLAWLAREVTAQPALRSFLSGDYFHSLRLIKSITLL